MEHKDGRMFMMEYPAVCGVYYKYTEALKEGGGQSVVLSDRLPQV